MVTLIEMLDFEHCSSMTSMILFTEGSKKLATCALNILHSTEHKDKTIEILAR